jgi:hypothetical protein
MGCLREHLGSARCCRRRTPCPGSECRGTSAPARRREGPYQAPQGPSTCASSHAIPLPQPNHQRNDKSHTMGRIDIEVCISRCFLPNEKPEKPYGLLGFPCDTSGCTSSVGYPSHYTDNRVLILLGVPLHQCLELA